VFVIVQNDPLCPPGSCLQLLAASGLSHRTIAAFREEPFPDPEKLSGIIVLGGDMGVHETERFPYLEQVRTFMGQALRAGTPLLGICLGGQLLAQVAGGQVASPSTHGEQGICRVTLTAAGAQDPLFSGVASPFVTFQLHNDSFSLPPGATLLADSAACPAQGFRLGATAYGVQFHPEVERDIVACWEGLPHPPLDLVSGFLSSQAAFEAASHTILANFISLAVASRRP
jgi:GMP synthase (glutamine-hydrolysing)